jgi:hypothetical protein
VLPDGRVLVAGGYSYAKKDTVRSADLVDPKSLAVTPAAPLNEDRNFAAAALLPDGQVLVAGGFAETRGTLGTAERYDPAANTWSVTRGAMNDRRELFTATPLTDGRVLLVGGLSLKKRETLTTAEVYDPATDAFTPTADGMQIDRFEHAAVRLADGRVLVVGGKSWKVGQPDHPLASAEIYDPATGRFRLVGGAMRQARSRPTATLLLDGRVLIAGGTDHGKPALACEIFDPRAERFTPAAPLKEGRMAHDAVRLPDGRVLVAGGWSDARHASTPTVEVYDPDADRWESLPDLPSSAHDLRLVSIDGGKRILAVAGKSTTGDEKTARALDTVVEVVLPKPAAAP